LYAPEHWRALSRRYLEDAVALLGEGRDASAVLVLCALIDAAASYASGRVVSGGVGTAFRSFADRFLPVFGRVQFGDLLFDDGKPVRDAADMLYHCYRNGLIHEGDLPFGMKLVRAEPDDAWLLRVCAVGTMELNVVPFYQSVCAAADQFARDLATDSPLQGCYHARLDHLQRPRFRKATAGG